MEDSNNVYISLVREHMRKFFWFLEKSICEKKNLFSV